MTVIKAGSSRLTATRRTFLKVGVRRFGQECPQGSACPRCENAFKNLPAAWVRPLAALLLCLAIIQSFGPTPLHAQMPPGKSSPAPNQSGSDVEKEFDEIFAQPAFRPLREKKPQEPEPESQAEMPDWLKRFLEWLGRLLGGTASAVSGLGAVLAPLVYAGLVAIGALIIWLVIRAVNNYRARQTLRSGARTSFEEGEGEIPPGDLPADEYMRRAAELAAKGLYREAIGQLILGAMSRTERGGLIRFRRGLTNRDYLRALRGRGVQHQAFRTIVGVYEPICFGRREAQIEHYQTSFGEYQTGFQQPLDGDGGTKARTAAGAK